MSAFYQNNYCKIEKTQNSSNASEQFVQVRDKLIKIVNSQAELISSLLKNQKFLLCKFIEKGQSNENNLYIQDFPEKLKCFQIHEKNGNDVSFRQKLLSKKSKKKYINRQGRVLQSEAENSLNEFSSSISDMSSEKDPQFSIGGHSQTKNVIKNFSKALFQFIQKYRVYVRKLLETQDMSQQKFYTCLQRYKGRIYTINQLRSFWLPSDNECHKIFRILSMQYVRKHHLNHIFYSRVTNHKIHNKYRKRIYDVLMNPEAFTHIKFG